MSVWVLVAVWFGLPHTGGHRPLRDFIGVYKDEAACMAQAKQSQPVPIGPSSDGITIVYTCLEEQPK